jgi:hypothetical protein
MDARVKTLHFCGMCCYMLMVTHWMISPNMVRSLFCARKLYYVYISIYRPNVHQVNHAYVCLRKHTLHIHTYVSVVPFIWEEKLPKYDTSAPTIVYRQICLDIGSFVTAVHVPYTTYTEVAKLQNVLATPAQPFKPVKDCLDFSNCLTNITVLSPSEDEDYVLTTFF